MDWHHFIAWAIFLAFVLVMLGIDLFVLHRKPHAIQMKEALIGAAVPVFAAMLFAGAVYFAYKHNVFNLAELPAHVEAKGPEARYYPTAGHEAAILFITGYLVEVSLSADNVFLFVVLMTFFRVPRELQHRVLFWGVLGALVMRGAMILAGTALIARFEWIIYLFGAFLIYTAFKLMFGGDAPKDPSDNIAVRLTRKFLPFQQGFDGQNFFTMVNGRRVATTLFLVLVCIEFTDLVFALDSIPAIFGITRDPFIVFTSNVFAILGLRSLYFLLAGIMDKFHFLKYGLAVVLGFVGVKMLLPGAGHLYGHFYGGTHHWEVDKYVSLAVIILSLAASIVLSLLIPSKEHHANPLEEPALGEGEGQAVTATPAPPPPTAPAS
jgi:tellurite resistance protein TerC